MRITDIITETKRLAEPSRKAIVTTVDESFDRPATWTKQVVYGGLDYNFSIEDHTYQAFLFDNHNNEWGFGFEYMGNGRNIRRYGYSDTGMMGKSAITVFSTVAAILESFVNEYHPNAIGFSGDKISGRSELYSKMIKHLSPRIVQLGYHSVRVDDNQNALFAFIKDGYDPLNENEILDEMPIQNISHVGNWEKNSSFNTQDRKLLTNPKAITKIKAMWKYPEDVDYNIVLVNNSEAKSFNEIGDIGDITGATTWIETNMPKSAADIVPNLKSDQINIIYTNNTGAQRVPMTGWICAHRFAHALFRSRFGKTPSHYFVEAAQTLSHYLGDLAVQYGIGLNGIGRGDRTYNALLSTSTRNLMSAICTFKSARDGNLRNTFEALHELFSQYIFKGGIKFNDIPRVVKVGNSKYSYLGGEDYDSDNHTIQHDLTYELNSLFETACHYAVGRVYVM